MFTVVPFHVPLAHIYYSSLIVIKTRPVESPDSISTVSTIDSRLNSPLLDSTHFDNTREDLTPPSDLVQTKGGAGPVESETRILSLSPPGGPESTLASVDSAIQSLPPLFGYGASSEETDVQQSDPTASIDSGLYSLPVGTLKPVDTSREGKEMSVQKVVDGMNKPRTPKMSQRNRGRCARCGKLVFFVLLPTSQISRQALIACEMANKIKKNVLGFGIRKSKPVTENGVTTTAGANTAERKVAMGQQWHQQCFRCATCGRFLDPGKHCEHEGQPYCNNCYKTNFGPDGFRGSIQPRPILEPSQTAQEKSDILTKIERYNVYKETNIEQIKHKETNGRIFFEGVIKIYWGLKKHIVLASGNSNYGRQRSRESSYNYVSIDDEGFDKMITNAHSGSEISKDELKRYMELSQFSLGTDELISQSLNEAALEAFTSNGLSSTDGAMNNVHTITEENDISQEYVLVHSGDGDTDDEGVIEERQCQSLTNSPSRQRVVFRQKSSVGENSIGGMRERSNAGVRRRSASFRKVQKYKKQEAREEKRSKFIPPYGKSTNLRVTSLQRTEEVIGMLLLKYNVENKPSEFSLIIVHDNGAMEKLDVSECPINTRLNLGPSEDVAKIYIMEKSDSEDLGLSHEAAEYISFQLPELQMFLSKFQEEEERELAKLKKRFEVWKDLIRSSLEDLDPLIPQKC